MSIKEIELAITQLTPEELFRFTVWFEEFQARSWDEQIKKDIEAGRLDKLIKEAEEDFKAGRCIGIVRATSIFNIIFCR